MVNLLENVNLLEHFLSAEGITHVLLVEALDGDLLPSQLVNAQCHFPKSSFANLLDQLIVLSGGLWNLVVPLYMVSNLYDKLLSI